jgi:Icc-related predicted phosphoesterase
VIRLAAIGDVHFARDSKGTWRPHLEDLAERADVLLVAGDLTRHGSIDEAEVLAEELEDLPVPTVAVLGNHDYHLSEEKLIRDVMERAGVRVLEGETARISVNGATLGIGGVKGFGGGFAGACGTEFGEPEMKSFIRHTKTVAESLRASLETLDTDYRVTLLHYAPIEGTLAGERREIFPFLGSYLLAEAIDEVGADLAIHGHAHGGVEKGVTPGGVTVRNVALPVVRCAYKLYCFGAETGPC